MSAILIRRRCNDAVPSILIRRDLPWRRCNITCTSGEFLRCHDEAIIASYFRVRAQFYWYGLVPFPVRARLGSEHTPFHSSLTRRWVIQQIAEGLNFLLICDSTGFVYNVDV